jgi:Tfp pilus assembly protein PilF
VSRLQSLLQAGLESLQAGRMADARAAFRSILEAAPHHPDAHYLLAHTEFIAGQMEEAERHLALALLHEPKRADFHLLLGNVLQRQGQLARAEGKYREALDLDPRYAEAQLNLGNVLGELGRIDDALAAYAAALALKPDLLAAQLNRAALLKRSGRLDEARREYERLAGRFSASAVVLYARARLEHDAGRLDEARRHYAALLAVHPQHSDGLNGLGTLLLAAGEEAAALEQFERCLAVDAGHRAALANGARVLVRHGQLERAAALLRRLLKLEPQDADTRLLLARALAEAGRNGEALEELLRLRKQAPRRSEVHLEIAMVYYDVGRFQNALTAVTRALELDPGNLKARRYHAILLGECGEPEGALAALELLLLEAPGDAELLSVIGVQLCALNRYEEGIARFRQALERDPQHARAHTNLAFALLATGDFANGWRHQRMKWGLRAEARQRPELQGPMWNGEPLAGKSLYVWAEQGLGDHIMFGGMFPDLLAAGAACTFEVHARLQPLFARSFPGAKVIAKRPRRREDTPAADYHAPMSGLGEFLRPDRERFPRHAGYLSADLSRRLRWRTRLTALGPGLRVGISWRGGTERTGLRERSIALEQWSAILRRPATRFVSLQYGDCRRELEALRTAGIDIAHWQEAVDDFDECAALLCELDLVVSVPTTVIHLAGALARPVWVLVPARPGWRYLLEGESLPWYPSARLWRQESPGEWEPLLERVARAIAAFAS